MDAPYNSSVTLLRTYEMRWPTESNVLFTSTGVEFIYMSNLSIVGVEILTPY